VPQVLVNGRLSDRSFRNWSKRPGLADALFENMAHVVAQSDLDAARFRALGARPVTVSGNLKVDVMTPSCDPAELQRLKAEIGNRRTWAAISTFEGEEAVCADVHRKLSTNHRALTIIVPRHPERGGGVEEMLKARSLKVARRSRNDPITADTDVFLGDTIGEMGLYLNLTEIAFVGKSLKNAGGQNPLEPAMVGCAVLSGRNVQNFRDSFQQLLKSGGAKIVKDEEMLARGVDYLMGNDAARRAMITAGKATVAGMRGALPRTIRALEPFINPLTVQARLQAHQDSGGGR
jgi:3-deoxy-D-manno-octulosonic-acid transferase